LVCTKKARANAMRLLQKHWGHFLAWTPWPHRSGLPLEEQLEQLTVLQV
jgi:hypothetical protein